VGSILCDWQIAALCKGESPLLTPFVPRQEGKPSYGLGSYGYDLRLGGRLLVVDSHWRGVLSPVGVANHAFEEVSVAGHYDLAPHSYVLAESVEKMHIPDDVFGVCVGKSSYARCGLLVNSTPLEPGWRGVLTIELANISGATIRLHVGNGIAQVVFYQGRRPMRTYPEKESGGLYQDQSGAVPPH
jgi:dCTP deaminase